MLQLLTVPYRGIRVALQQNSHKGLLFTLTHTYYVVLATLWLVVKHHKAYVSIFRGTYSSPTPTTAAPALLNLVFTVSLLYFVVDTFIVLRNARTPAERFGYTIHHTMCSLGIINILLYYSHDGLLVALAFGVSELSNIPRLLAHFANVYAKHYSYQHFGDNHVTYAPGSLSSSLFTNELKQVDNHLAEAVPDDALALRNRKQLHTSASQQSKQATVTPNASATKQLQQHMSITEQYSWLHIIFFIACRFLVAQYVVRIMWHSCQSAVTLVVAVLLLVFSVAALGLWVVAADEQPALSQLNAMNEDTFFTKRSAAELLV